jgi:hypothetical protein
MRDEELERAYAKGSPEVSAAIASGVDVSILVENMEPHGDPLR